MKTTLEKISPSIAKKMLEQNVDNRPVSPSYVSGLAESIRRGEWKITHQGICFGKSGRLLDGQHRLMAIIEANHSVSMMVTRGADDETFDSLDLGRKRRFSDVLGVPQGMAAVARFMAMMEDTTKTSGITPQLLVPFLEAIATPYQELIDFCPKVTKTWSAAAIRTAAILKIMDGEDKDYVHLVYYALNHAEFDSMPPIAQTLMRQSLDGKIKGGSVDFFIRCLKVFDRSSRDQRNLLVKSAETGLQYARELISREVHGVEIKKRPQQSAAKATKVGREFSRLST